MTRGGVAWAALCLATACGQSAPEPPTETRASAITKGTPDSAHAAVVALLVPPLTCGEASPGASCTGTLVAPRAVLTAGHCVAEGSASVVEVGATIGAAGNPRRRVVRSVRHPKYQRDDSEFDLAIVWLDAAIDSVAPVDTGTGPPTPADGETLTVVGFGQTRAATEPEGQRRAGSVRVTSTTARTISYAAAPSMSCLGDSGGPVLASTGAGERLVGVVSAGDNGCSKAGTATRVDAAFVAEVVAAPPPLEIVGVGLSCDGKCARDADCRPGLVCRQARDGVDRCTISGFEPGVLTRSCAAHADCPSGTSCTTTFDGCQCYEPCAGPPEPIVTGPDPKSTPAAAPASPGELEGGCSSAPGGAGRDAWAWLVAAVVTGARRRRR